MLQGHYQHLQQTRYESLHSLSLALFRCTILRHRTTWHGERIYGELAGYTSTVCAQCRYRIRSDFLA